MMAHLAKALAILLIFGIEPIALSKRITRAATTVVAFAKRPLCAVWHRQPHGGYRRPLTAATG